MVTPAETLTLTDNKNPITGTVPDNGYTNDPTPTVTLSVAGANKGDTITVQWTNGTQTFSKTIKVTQADLNNGFASFNVPKLAADGQYTFSVTSDTFGATYPSTTMTLDTVKPKITSTLVTSDNTLTNSEDQHGFDVTGSILGGASMRMGDQVTVILTDDSGDVAKAVGTITGLNPVGNGQYSATFSVHFNGGALPLGSSGYEALVDYTNDAGVTAGTTTFKFEAICFMAGTMIRTPDGEVAVETLKPGDLVITSEGKAAAVTWLGRQTVSTIFTDPLRTLPIRIKADALGENVPSRDLLISPDHAVLVDGVLVQAGALVNGQSIVRESKVPQVFTYYHVELADHSLIMAENTPAETFIDNVDRLAFDNWHEHQALYPNGQTINEMSYPRAKAHRQVPRSIRERLSRRAHALAELAATAA